MRLIVEEVDEHGVTQTRYESVRRLPVIGAPDVVAFRVLSSLEDSAHTVWDDADPRGQRVVFTGRAKLSPEGDVTGGQLGGDDQPAVRWSR